jgi:hypothetical protein
MTAVDIQNMPPIMINMNDRPYAIAIENALEPITGSTEPAMSAPKNMHNVPTSQNNIVLISAMNRSFVGSYLNLTLIEPSAIH